jgi:3-isopropylmalate dehydratase small subunit
MKQFSDMFDDNLINNQVPHDRIEKSNKKAQADKFEKPDDKILIEHKRERTVSENK